MTLIAVNFAEDIFYALSDSRVSEQSGSGARKITDRLVKIFPIPYRFTAGSSSAPEIDTIGELGFAFAGSVLLATALQAMSANVLRNMHNDIPPLEAPSFEALAECILTCARLLHEDTVVGGPRPYDAFVFGFCPKSGHPKLKKLTLLMRDSVYEYTMVDVPLSEGITHAIGSGAGYFRELSKLNEQNVAQGKLPDSLEMHFLKSVSGNPDPGTGGFIQMMKVDRSGADFLGLLQADADLNGAKIVVSGVTKEEIGIVEGYQLGRILMGIGIPQATNRGALRRLGYDPDDPKLTQEVRNKAAFSSMLRYLAGRSEQGVVDNQISLEAPKPIKDEFYFSKVCTACFLVTPLLHDDSNGSNLRPFNGSGSISAKCIHCGETASISAVECVSRRWK